MSDSRIADFYRLGHAGRVRVLAERGLISAADAETLLANKPLLAVGAADRMIENVIGVFGLPLAVAPNFLVNGKDYIVPMVVEEPSIVAAVSSAAKLARESGGFSVSSNESILIGQIQIVDAGDPDPVMQSLDASRDEMLALANAVQPGLKQRGGGACDLECFKFRLPDGRWTVVLHLLVDTRDAMGANAVNTMCEGLAPHVERISGGKVSLKIISNLTDRALVNVTVTLPASLLGQGCFSGEQVREGIVLANDFANVDPYRAATHNKGIMNGIDAVAVATGNDWRSVEAGAHAYAARDGQYRALTKWSAASNGDLLGQLVMPIKVGVVGGSQSSNPSAAIGLRIAGTDSAPELAGLMGAVGLAQNFAALRALVSDGIQKGHMSLHARSVAAAAGAPDEIFDQVVAGMIDSGEVKQWKARELIDELIDELQRRDDVAATVRANDVSTNDVSTNGSSTNAVAEGTAAGKVILLGEHAAVYDKHVLALPLESGVVVRIAESTAGTQLTIPDWHVREEISGDARPQSGASAVLTLVMQDFGIADRGYDIRVRSRLPVAMGLGSSAALAVAVIRAFDELTSRGMSDLEVERLAFECEKVSHGTPSGIDNNIATYGQPVLFRKGRRTPAQQIQLAEVPPLVIASSGIRGNTKEQVAGVRLRYDGNPALYKNIFNEMDDISVAGASALAKCDYGQLGSMMNVCHGLLNAIEVSTPELEKMISIARNNGACGAKLTGAGGGGSIVALCPGSVNDVARALEAADYRIVRMENR